MDVYLHPFRTHMKYIDVLLRSKKTVFSNEDLKFLFQISNRNTLKSLLSRLVKNGILLHPSSWIYTFPHSDDLEFAVHLKKKSYISFETVLKQKSIIFQDYGNTIFLASDKTISKSVFWKCFEYHKLKDTLLLNPMGITQTGTYAIASPERAVCDRLYLSPNYYFDNIDPLNAEKLLQIAKIYNQRVVLSVKKILNA